MYKWLFSEWDDDDACGTLSSKRETIDDRFLCIVYRVAFSFGSVETHTAVNCVGNIHWLHISCIRFLFDSCLGDALPFTANEMFRVIWFSLLTGIFYRKEKRYDATRRIHCVLQTNNTVQSGVWNTLHQLIRTENRIFFVCLFEHEPSKSSSCLLKARCCKKHIDCEQSVRKMFYMLVYLSNRRNKNCTSLE